MGSEAIEGLRFLASCPLSGTGQREGGKKTQPFNRFHSRLGIHLLYDDEASIKAQFIASAMCRSVNSQRPSRYFTILLPGPVPNGWVIKQH